MNLLAAQRYKQNSYCANIYGKLINQSSLFKNMIVSQNDIVEIKAGATKSFSCETPQGCNSAKTQVWHVKRLRKMPANVKDYRVSVDYDTCTVTVTAVKNEAL